MHTPYTGRRRIAYFSMEIALRPEFRTYAGGLGILAGDVVRSSADLDLPLVAVTLVSRAGYFRQSLDPDGTQCESADPWDPAATLARLDARVAVILEGREVWIGGWLYVQRGITGGEVPVLLLDTDLPDNAADDRRITDQLYGGDARYRLKQQVVLGIGGVRLLRALGFRPRAYHLNEGHSALLTLQLLRDFAVSPRYRRPGDAPFDVQAARELCIFTTHTPVEAAHDRYPYELWDSVVGEFVDAGVLRALAGNDVLNMTRLAAAMSTWINGVAEQHARTAQREYPGREVRAITNGVHAPTWVAAPIAALFDAAVGDWQYEPEGLARIPHLVSTDALWAAHLEAKQRLCAATAQRTGIALRPDVPILGFARRMTAYKRPHLLLNDLERLRAIARRQPFQLVFAGKAHPADQEGKRLIREIHGSLAALRPDIASAWLPNYGWEDAALLVSGSDVWLNTPLPPLEASGTSGMKAALNGVPSLSVLDGWWVEGCLEGVTGWGIADGDRSSEDATRELLDKLEHVVLPAWYGPRAAWAAVMHGAIGLNGSFFQSHRMMRRYASEAYAG